MEGYLIRKAGKSDIAFLADTVIAAEKGRSDKLSYSTLFNVSENRARDLIMAMFEEEVDGCELSVSSFLVAEQDGKTVAALGSWIECFEGSMPSAILKSNLIFHTYEDESIEFFKTVSHISKDIFIEKEPLSLQFEYIYISPEHLGKGLDTELFKRSEELAREKYPGLKKAQSQLFKNNILAVIVLKKKGFNVVRSCRSDNAEILNYIPFNEKLLMEKVFETDK